ncbi:hypothetical protein [Caballeronia sp. Sq4a]|uniref:hypothetical protein n=1 Tax=Caballeronia sp. Sq4a TaxID=2878152 RepID=UPI0020BDA517|nr:hypothetical protein [Caballeronia sp. Sq4a]
MKIRIKAEGECSDIRLQNDIIRLADIAEYELGFDAVLHGHLAIVRARAKRRHVLMALALFDSALTEFSCNRQMLNRGTSGAQRITCERPAARRADDAGRDKHMPVSYPPLQLIARTGQLAA